MTQRLALVCLCLLMGCALSTAAQAQSRTQDIRAVWQAAEVFAREQTQSYAGEVLIEIAPPDHRVRLAACKSLKPSIPPAGRLWGKTHVAVRCEGPDTWSLMVPLTVKVMGTALYAGRPIPRGQKLTVADIEARPSDLTQLPAGVMTDSNEAIDKVASIALSAGLPLRREMLKGESVVLAGEDVSITFTGTNVRVSSMGKSMNNGAVGDSIQVRAASGKIIRATVTGKGAVEVR
jgi:flagella basal body P-ring formation protein FlgA